MVIYGLSCVQGLTSRSSVTLVEGYAWSVLPNFKKWRKGLKWTYKNNWIISITLVYNNPQKSEKSGIIYYYRFCLFS